MIAWIIVAIAFIMLVSLAALWPEIYLFALLISLKLQRYLER